MGKIRYILSVWVCKILIIAGRIAGKKGSSTPGAIALKICPGVLNRLASQVKGQIIATCGTNGKTTTNNLICFILEKKGYQVVCNRVGANMLPGVVTAFIEKAGIFGTLNADYATIEMDEASAAIIFRHFVPDYVVLTNLFRDQLDRYGEIDLTVQYLKNALMLAKDAVLVINGDDPICAMIGKDNNGRATAFGISEDAHISLNEIREGQFCSYCGEKLCYHYYHYSQLGDYYCDGCGFSRPEIDFEATQLNISGGLSFVINNDTNISVNYRGFYNIYNILAAVSVMHMLSVDTGSINEILLDYRPQAGRMETFDIGKPVILNLSKNPAGFNQGIFTVLSDEKTKDVVVMINDNPQDGTDISWIWDVDFEKLNDDKVKNIGFAGIRRKDTAVRFKYASVLKGNTVYDTLKQAVCDMLKKDGEVIYLLVNYTAIFDAQDLLIDMQKQYKEGK